MAERELHDVTDRAEITVTLVVDKEDIASALAILAIDPGSTDQPSEHLRRAAEEIGNSLRTSVEDRLRDAYHQVAKDLGVSVKEVSVEFPDFMAQAIGMALTSARLAVGEEHKATEPDNKDFAALIGSITRNTKRHAGTVGQITFRLSIALSALIGVIESGEWSENPLEELPGPVWDDRSNEDHRLDVEELLHPSEQDIDYAFARKVVANVVDQLKEDRLGKALVNAFLQQEGAIDKMEYIGRLSFERLLKLILAKSSRAGDKMMDIEIPEGVVDIAAAEIFIAMVPDRAPNPPWSQLRMLFILHGAMAISSLDDYLTRSYLPYALMETIGGIVDPNADGRANIGANIVARTLERIGLLDEFDPTKMAYGVGGPMKMDSKSVIGDLESDE